MRYLLTLAVLAGILAGPVSRAVDLLAQDAAAPIRVGGEVRPPTRTRDVPPRYPEEAQRAGIQGIVIVETTIDASGRVRDARVIRSIPALDEAALEAVRQWEYTPTLLNGVPVPVILSVTVTFSLQGGAAPASPLPVGADQDRAASGRPSMEECFRLAADQPAQMARNRAAIQFAEEVYAKQRSSLIARQADGFVPLDELPGAPEPPPGFAVQFLAEASRYALSAKDVQDACGIAVFSDQQGVVFLAVPVSGSVR